MQLNMYCIFHCGPASTPGTMLLLTERNQQNKTRPVNIRQPQTYHPSGRWLMKCILHDWMRTDAQDTTVYDAKQTLSAPSPAPCEQWTARHNACQQLPSPVAGTGTEWYTAAGTNGHTNPPPNIGSRYTQSLHNVWVWNNLRPSFSAGGAVQCASLFSTSTLWLAPLMMGGIQLDMSHKCPKVLVVIWCIACAIKKMSRYAGWMIHFHKDKSAHACGAVY